MGVWARPMLLVLAITGGGIATSAASAQQTPPVTPDPNFATTVLPRPCAYEGGDPLREARSTRPRAGRARTTSATPAPASACASPTARSPSSPARTTCSSSPVTIEKPVQDGYITRFKPEPGARRRHRAAGRAGPPAPRHLALASPTTAAAPFFAAGEEKTIAPVPARATACRSRRPTSGCCSTWSTRPSRSRWTVYITYDIDFVPQAKARAARHQAGLPDLARRAARRATRSSTSSATSAARTARARGRSEECADFDPYGKQIVGQGQPGNGIGKDFELPERRRAARRDRRSSQGGTLIGIGGHLHPGGHPERDRPRARRRSRSASTPARPRYWDRNDPTKPGGPPTSWDFSMRVTGLPYWGVHVKPGDIAAQQRDLRHDASSRPTRTWASRSRCSRPTRRTASPTAPGRRPVHGADRHLATAATSGGLRGRPRRRSAPTGSVTHGHCRRTATTAARRAAWNAQGRRADRATSRSPTSSTRRATSRRSR